MRDFLLPDFCEGEGNLFEIIHEFTTEPATVERRSRMVERKEVCSGNAREFFDDELAMGFGYFFGWEEMVHCMPSEKDNELWIDHGELGMEPVFARIFFFGEGIAVAGRAVFDDVGDIDVITVHTDACKHFIEEFARSSYKWYSCLVLLFAGCFSNEDDVGASIAVTKDSACSGCFELAGVGLGPVFMKFK